MRIEQRPGVQTERQHTEHEPLDIEKVQTAERATRRSLQLQVERFSAKARRVGTALLSLFILGSEAQAGVRLVEREPQSEEERENAKRENDQWREAFRTEALRAVEPLRVPPESIELALREQPDWSKDVGEFQHLIQEFAAAGFHIELKPMLFLKTRSQHPNPELQNREYDFKSSLLQGLLPHTPISVSETPLDSMVASSLIELEHPSVIQDTTEPIPIAPYQLTFRQEGERSTVILTNWLTGRVMIAFDLASILPTFDSSNEQSMRVSDGIVCAIQEAIQQEAELTAKALEQLTHSAEAVAARPPAYTFYGSEPHAQIHDIVQQVKTISFTTIGFGRDMDRVNSTGIEIDASFLERSGALPIQIHGSIDHLNVQREYQQNVDGEHAPATSRVQKATDQYGNMILKMSSSHFDQTRTTETIWEHILVYPPTVFAKETGSEDPVHPLSVDLNAVGVDVHLKEYFYVPVERPIATMTDGAYQVYSSLPHAYTLQEYGKWFEPIGEGMKRAEELFGFTPGEAAQQLLIVNSKDPNAHFHPKDPHAIVFRDEQFVESSIASVGFHETAHLLDATIGLNDHDDLLQLHATLSRDFFRTINEHAWYPGETGGHSADNVAEFIASFLNSLIDPRWEQTIQQRPQSFQQEYLHAMNVFASVLDECTQPLEAASEHKKTLSSTAPIHALLKQRIAFLSK